jgi:bacteriorhodopsin
VLWGELGEVLKKQTEEVRILVRNLRLLLLGTWGVYPIAYMLPFFGLTGPEAFVGVQLGYTLADVLAKPGFGLLIFAIAVAKTRADASRAAAPAPAGD